MTIKDLAETVSRAEEQGMPYLPLKYNPGDKWKHQGQNSVRTPLGLARILGPSYDNKYIVVALPLNTAKRYLAKLKGNLIDGS